jgi:CSLREA domain-containing protein
MKAYQYFRIGIMLLILVGAITGMRPLAPATTINVNTFSDEYGTGANCSLREAIQAANIDSIYGGCAAGEAVSDTISLPAGTYTLTITGTNEDLNAAGDLDISGGLSIIGQETGAIIDAAGIDRVLDTLGGSSVTLENLTITGGHAPDGDGSVADGGGIRSAGSLTLTDVTISGNQAGKGAGGAATGASGGFGGGIYSSYASLSILDSIITDNNAGAGEDGKEHGFGGEGGGIYIDGGTNTITGSTISNNLAGDAGASASTAIGGSGGGIHARGALTITASTISGNTAGSSSTSIGGRGGGIYANSDTTIINCTVSGNTSGSSTAGSGSPGYGGGVVASSDMLIRYSTITDNHIGTGTGTGIGGGIFSEGSDYLTLGATIVAGNMDDDDTYPDCYQTSSINSEDYNLIGDTRGCTLSVTPANNILDPVGFSLPSLGNFGGLTQTHPLTTGNPAVDWIPSGTAGCGTDYTTDQRGVLRPINGTCDIGSFEMQLLGFLPLIKNP